MEHLLWQLTSTPSTSTEMLPLIRAALVCGLLYQIDLALALGSWLLRKLGIVSSSPRLEPQNRRSAVVVLPTLLRKRAELEGLIRAARSVASNGYPAPLCIVPCIDGIDESPALYRELAEWAAQEPVAPGIQIHVAGTRRRSGKAVAMHAGVDRLQDLVARGRIARMPEIFFNMDADSILGERALERMAYRLTRRRWILRAPYHIVTSNVVVPLEQCYRGPASLLRRDRWIALLVAREYLSSITLGKLNWKILPRSEVSGALYCTWSAVHLAAPRYARFMQSLTVKEWLKWWLGWPPPSFSRFRGAPLPEAMTGPGDDTWIGWLAATATWKNGRMCFDAPRTPLHARGRLMLCYV